MVRNFLIFGEIRKTAGEGYTAEYGYTYLNGRLPSLPAKDTDTDDSPRTEISPETEFNLKLDGLISALGNNLTEVIFSVLPV